MKLVLLLDNKTLLEYSAHHYSYLIDGDVATAYVNTGQIHTEVNNITNRKKKQCY